MKVVLTGKDLVTLVMLVGAFVLRSLGINSLTEYIIIAIAVGYLGLKVKGIRPRRLPKEGRSLDKGKNPTD